jgi:hypothetical protein
MDVSESPISLKFKMDDSRSISSYNKHADVLEIEQLSVVLVGQQKRQVFDWLRLFRVLWGILQHSWYSKNLNEVKLI